MVGLARPSVLPDGRRAMIDGDVADVARRMHDGDPSLLWRGDPALYLEWDYQARMFVVMRANEDGRTVQVMFWPPPLDARLLVHLRDHDLRRPDVERPVDFLARKEAELQRAADDKAVDDGLDILAGVAYRVMLDTGADVARLWAVGAPGGDSRVED